MHNSMLNSFAEVGEAIAGQFTGLKKLDINLELDNRCYECNGRGEIKEYTDQFLADEEFSDPPIITSPRIAPKLSLSSTKTPCPHCNASGIIVSKIKINCVVEKQKGEKKPEETTKKK